MGEAALRNKLYDYIRVADDKKLKAIYELLGHEIDATVEWWKDKDMVAEIDARYEALQSGKDKGLTKDELTNSISKARQKRYNYSAMQDA